MTPATSLTAAIAERGECEFMADFADPMPVRVMCAPLGVPPTDCELFRRWSTDVGLVYSFTLPQLRTRVEEAVVGLRAYVDSLIEQRRAEPRDDLVSALIAAEESGDRLSTEELRNLALTLVFAAHDTTRNQLGQALATFSEYPDQWRLLAIVRAFSREDHYPRLSEVTVPTVVVVGSADRSTPPSHSHRLAAGVPGARLVTVPDAGHLLNWEAPDVLVEVIASLQQ